MALIIEDPEVERLAAEVAALSGSTTPAAVRDALRARRDQLMADRMDAEERCRYLYRFLENEVWSQLPADQLGKPISTREQEDNLGFGPHGA